MKHASARTIKLGLIQTACSADPDENLEKTLALASRAARRGAQIICTQELFRSQYFCQNEDHKNFKLAEPIPGPTTDAFCKLAKKHKVVVIASLFEKRAAGVYHNTAAIIDAERLAAGPLPEDAHSRRPALLRKILFHARRPRIPSLADALRQNRRADMLGPVVSGSRAAHRLARRANPVLPDCHRLASPRKEKTTANASTARGKPSSAATPSPTAATSPLPIASGMKNSRAGALNFGARVSWPGPPAKSSPKPASAKEEILIVPVDLAAVDDTRTHWPFLRDRRIDAYGNLTKRLVD